MRYCINCGEPLPATARFCAACGTNLEGGDAELTRIASEETRFAAARSTQGPSTSPAPRRTNLPSRIPADEEEERTIFVVRPTLLFVKVGYALAALGGLLLVALLTWGLGVGPLVSIPLALALLLVPAYYHLRRNTVRYVLTDSKIEIDTGFLSRTTRNVPLRNVQDVTVTATVTQRLMRFGDLVVDNASEEGGLTVLRNIPDPRRHAALLLREVRRWR